MRCPKSWGYPKTYGFQYCSLVKWIGWFGVSHGIQYFRKPPGLNGQNRGCHNGTLYNYSATPSQLRNCNDIDFTSRFLRRRMRSHLCQAIVSKSSIVSWTDFVEGIQVLFFEWKAVPSFPSPSPNIISPGCWNRSGTRWSFNGRLFSNSNAIRRKMASFRNRDLCSKKNP